ncbi:MAG: C39 family peptidase [Patescibacteria group bacterium]|jgi:hypothetical protein
MKKIYIVLAGAFLILLVIISIILSLGKKSTTTTQKNTPFPTSIPTDQSLQSLPSQSPNQLPIPTTIVNSLDVSPDVLAKLSAITPVETADFKLQYSSRLQKIVVEKKTPQAETEFVNWANQNSFPQLIGNQNLTLIVDQGKNPDDFNPVIDFLNIFMNMGQGNPSSNNNQANPSSTLQSPSPSSLAPNSLAPSPSFTYYPQCGDQGDLPLPDGCNLCQAGCGPTTVSMIAASYLGNSYTPKTIVNMYQSKGYLLGCDGSRYSDAKQILQDLGLKTTDYLVFNAERSDTVVPDLKKYLAAGWTFFTLASFCDGGCGHYFWITDIDAKGNIYAYDPAYGRYEIPYNENTRYPYPLYRLAFGVKK